MINAIDYALVFIITFIVSMLMTPVSIWIAKKNGIITVPDDGRRMHARHIPRLGGLAIFVASTVGLLIFARQYSQITTVVFGGALMYLVGLFDDLKGLKAWQKLIAQLAVIILMYVMGIRISFIQNYFGVGTLDLGGVMTFLVTVLWMLGITNAINLIDGLDGLAAGTVCIDALCMGYISYIVNGSGRVAVTTGMLALAGSCLGFLPFNFSPARTFMGDGGALYLGFMFAGLTAVGRLKSPTIITMMLPILVIGIPVFDTLFAIIRRFLTKKPIMDADKGHLHHFLMAAGHGHARSVLMMYCLSGIMCMASVSVCRKLYYDAGILLFIALTFIFVFLTDQKAEELARKQLSIKERETRRSPERKMEE